MAGNPINTTRKRRELKPRHQPYWAQIRRGIHVGFHKSPTGGTWRARVVGPDGKYRYEVLGPADAMDFDGAADRTLAFAEVASRAERPDYRVADAVADYVEHLRKENGPRAADDAKGRLTKHVLPRFGAEKLTDLRSRDLNRWLHGLIPDDADETEQRRAKSSANRLLNSLKAALNLAFYDGTVPSDGEWRRVKGFPNADQARTLFLEPSQVTALLNAARGPFHDMLRAAVLTGARYGELTRATVRDLDTRGGTLRLDGKTGPRHVYLSNEALRFFARLSRDKLPDAPLLMREDGTAWKRAQQQKPMAKAVAAADLPPETVFYSLRHYHISRALLARIPAQVVAENCGTSIRMLEKHYGKFMATDRREMFEQMAL